jgi:hypothetical protein
VNLEQNSVNSEIEKGEIPEKEQKKRTRGKIESVRQKHEGRD